LSAVRLIGPLQSRTRRLNDAEIFALWRASGKMAYPVGPVYRALLLTGLRLREVADISWSEIHGNTIIIPPSRMKGREGKAVEHQVPVSSALQEVIASVPRVRGGPFLFSLKAGKQPVSMTGPMKRDLDRRMLLTLRAMARRRGEDHHAVDLPRWTNHDLRRVVRSGLSQLPIPHNVAEAVLAHPPPGIVGVYEGTNIWMRSARRWRHGRSGSRPSSVRSRCPARSSGCGGGGDDRVRVLHSGSRTRTGFIAL
jgi:integrase